MSKRSADESFDPYPKRFTPSSAPWIRRQTHPSSPPTSSPSVSPAPRSLEIMKYAFPLTKNSNKRMSVYISERFVPNIQLESEKANRFVEKIPMSIKDIDILCDEKIHEDIRGALSKGEDLAPFQFENLILSTENTGSFTYVTIQPSQQSDTIIYLGLSSWEMLKHVQPLIHDKIEEYDQICLESKFNFGPLMQLCAETLRGKSMKELPIQQCSQLIRTALQGIDYPFPRLMKNTLLCYHIEFLREKLCSHL